MKDKTKEIVKIERGINISKQGGVKLCNAWQGWVHVSSLDRLDENDSDVGDLDNTNQGFKGNSLDDHFGYDRQGTARMIVSDLNKEALDMWREEIIKYTTWHFRNYTFISPRL